ncbi:MAG: NUDIX domain-containing protein [candidate division Zixibacteria bacterium]|nr:NUDIX domain-containing protein [candidate division Zixibacteria bacterium]
MIPGKPHRISVGGLTFKDNAVLLVRYPGNNGGSFLVGPGGGLKDNEDIVQAIVRETIEETGVTVRPHKLIAVEDLDTRHFRMVKIWMLCDYVRGQVSNTDGACKEGITAAGWFTRDQLETECVYPSLLIKHDWAELQKDTWHVECMPCRVADF